MDGTGDGHELIIGPWFENIHVPFKSGLQFLAASK